MLPARQQRSLLYRHHLYIVDAWCRYGEVVATPCASTLVDYILVSYVLVPHVVLQGLASSEGVVELVVPEEQLLS